MKQETGNYDDIIHLPHHVSKRHPQMPMEERAAQFSPFAALSGHEEAIQETARLTDEFILLDEDKKERLNEQLMILKEKEAGLPEVEVIYFQPDEKKSGGAYVTFRGQVKKVDAYAQKILFTDGTALSMEALFSIRGELFGQDIFWD